MPTNNINEGANGRTAYTTASFASEGITSSNIWKIYELGALPKVYVPGAALNDITGFTAGKDYYIVAKVAMYISAVVPLGTILMGSDDNYYKTLGDVLSVTVTPAEHGLPSVSGVTVLKHTEVTDSITINPDRTVIVDSLIPLNGFLMIIQK